MRTIRISTQVWEAMANVGRFGETPDDVLRRVFNIEGKARGSARANGARGPRMASDRMSAKVDGHELRIEFGGGGAKIWALPKRDDKAAIRQIREAAVEFARENGATHGQRNAVRKALTDAGYHLAK